LNPSSARGFGGELTVVFVRLCWFVVLNHAYSSLRGAVASRMEFAMKSILPIQAMVGGNLGGGG
jgi:hypothetical protein